MQNHPSVVPVVQYWEEYLHYDPTGNLEQFGLWLQQKEKRTRLVAKQVERMPDGTAKKNAHDFPKPGHYVGYLIGRLFKFVRFYMKPIIQQGVLSSLDEWVVMATLYELKEANKKDVIIASLTETTTGLDIIRRLVRHQIFEEKTDPTDRRAKLLTMTEKGKFLLRDTMIGLQQMPDILPNLSEDEQAYLIHILETLDHYHTQAYHAQDSKS